MSRRPSGSSVQSGRGGSARSGTALLSVQRLVEPYDPSYTIDRERFEFRVSIAGIASPNEDRNRLLNV